MGLVSSEEELESLSSGKVGFSRDVLNIEISGPTQLHLAIIDLPGLFYS
jgi:hypothetical protein